MTTVTDDVVVRAIGVRKRFGTHEVLRGIDLTVRRGQVVVLLGASGAGKSTFLRCMNRLEVVDEGEIWVGDQPIGFRQRDGKLHALRESALAAQRAEIGMVFQRFNLFPHRTGKCDRGADAGPRRAGKAGPGTGHRTAAASRPGRQT